MGMPSQTVRWATIILSFILLAAAGAAVVVLAPTGAGKATAEVPEMPLEGATDTRFSVHQPISLPREQFPPLPIDAHPSARGQVAHYDDIVVAVQRDGTLKVLGERMEMEALQALLSGPLREQLQMMVTIHPDDNCPFRYVWPVISICEESGVPHQTQPGPVVAGVDGAPGDPA